MALVNNDRILILKKEDPKATEIGLVDSSIFEGKNNLRITLNTSNCLWYFRYEHGTVPPILRGKFTSFKAAYEHAEIYLKTKKIKIVEVIW